MEWGLPHWDERGRGGRGLRGACQDEGAGGHDGGAGAGATGRRARRGSESLRGPSVVAAWEEREDGSGGPRPWLLASFVDWGSKEDVSPT